MSDSVIQIKNLEKSFKNLEVLRGINLEVKKGTMLALLGPNGAGKTTIVRILSTLLSPDKGEVIINGYSVREDSNKVRSSIGLTGQYAAVDEYLTGKENLVMMGRLYHLGKTAAQKRADELLKEFDLVDASDRIAKTYSGGMRRRLDLAISLIATPPILFLDEPTTGLDPRSRQKIWEIIEKLLNQGTTILLTTQYLEEADKLADVIAVLDQGKIIAQGTADELKAKVGNEKLEITLLNQNELENAARIIGGAVEIIKDERRIVLGTEGTVTEVRRILDLMAEAHIDIETLSLHKPTLDDVFLKLTGHQAETSNSNE